MKSLKKTDRLFFAAIIAGALLHLLFLFSPHFLYDESFYATIPFRLVRGDSLVQDEWHLSQFSSLFTFLPVQIWIWIKGSASGMILYLRCVFLTIHTAAAILIYRFFRSYKQWAILAALLFYLQVPYKIYAISYNSMFVLFLLFFTLCLLSIYRTGRKKFYIAAGLCFAACCVNNPLFCAICFLYLLLFALWKKRNDLFASLKTTRTNKVRSKTTGRKRKQAVQQIIQDYETLTTRAEPYNCFFSKQAILYSALGIGTIVFISVIFFFGTGGTISSIIQNKAYLLNSSEYGLSSLSILGKFKHLWNAIDGISFHMPFLLPLLFLALLIDKRRTVQTHRLVYLILSVFLSVLFIIGMICHRSIYTLALSLPFSLLSTVCYIITKKKNISLFVCMWCPCAIACAISLFASNTLLTSVGLVMTISNIAGVFFVRDLLTELSTEAQALTVSESQSHSNRKGLQICRLMICIGLCLQIGFYGFALQFKQLPTKDPIKATEGPFSGMLMNEQQYNAYEASLRDLDLIKTKAGKTEPVLIVSYQNWMYLYVDHPIATYTTWFYGGLRVDNLREYYRMNPEKIPKYIYVVNKDKEDFADININNVTENMEKLHELFDFTEETLSDGILMTVSEYKPHQIN